jgi:erythromycin esterase
MTPDDRPTDLPTDSPTDLLDSLRTHSLALESTAPDGDPARLRAFDRALADVDVVGLGEATHRTREFARFKHRLVRYLVTAHDLRAFALEAPVAETLALRDYVVDGIGDLRDALDDVGFQIYETEEVVACFEWLRAFNESRPPGDRVAVYGFDVQSAAGPARALHSYLDARRGGEHGLGPRDGGFVVDDLRDALDEVADGVVEGEDVDEDRLRTAERAADALAEWFDSEDAAPGNATLARRHLRTLRQACEFARTGLDADRTGQWGLRDRFMAENVAWIREHTGADLVAVWAHNNHVKTGRLGGDGYPSLTMGEHLARRFGDGYYALGAQFAHGTARAYAPVDPEALEAEDDHVELAGDTLAMTELDVPKPPEGSVPALFSRLDADAALLDVRSLPDDSPLRSWFAAERPHRYVSGVVDPDDENAFVRSHRALDVFDGVFFVDDVTPTRPL